MAKEKSTLKIKKLAKSMIEFDLEITPEMLEKWKPVAYKKLSEQVKIDGFRSGHIPASVIEQNYSADILKAHIVDVAFPQIYFDVIKENNLQVIAQPEVNEKTADPLVFTVKVAVLPEVKVGDYKKIKIKKEEVKVGKKEVDEVLKDLRKRNAVYNETEDKAKNDDKVEINFEGFDEKGKSLDNTQSTRHPLVLGSKTMVPGFEDEIVGMKKGDKKEFTITFPKDYHNKDFQKKKVTFKVEIEKVEACVLPEIDEEFIEKITGKKQDQKEFEKMIKENLQNQMESDIHKKREDELLQKIVDMTKVDLPDALIEEEKDFMLNNMKQRISQQNIPYEQYLSHIKKSEEELKKEFEPEAKNRITLRLALQHIIPKENIEIPEDAIKARIDMIKSWYPKKNAKKLDKEYAVGSKKYENNLYQMKVDRFLEMMLEN